MGLDGVHQTHVLYDSCESLYDSLVTAYLRSHEADGLAAAASTGCSTHAVDIVHRVAGDVMVDDEVNLGDIEASAGDIGGHEDLGVTRLEAGQPRRPLPLRLDAVQGRGLEADPSEQL